MPALTEKYSDKNYFRILQNRLFKKWVISISMLEMKLSLSAPLRKD